jgi:hypothetical protein
MYCSKASGSSNNILGTSNLCVSDFSKLKVQIIIISDLFKIIITWKLSEMKVQNHDTRLVKNKVQNHFISDLCKIINHDYRLLLVELL